MADRLAARIIATGVSAALIATPAMARKASTLTDLVGASGSAGEAELTARGFEHIRTVERDAGTKQGYWWHAADKDCIRVLTADGRYTSIADASRGDCGKKSSGTGTAVAVAAVGAAALAAILLSRKSKDRHDSGYQHDWQHVEVYRAKSGRLDIRDSPSKNARLLDRVADGTLLRNYGCDDYNGKSWCEVATMDLRTRGWARDKYLRVTATGGGYYPPGGGVGGDLVEVHGLQSEPLKLRSGLSKNDDVIGRVNVGTILRRSGCQYSEGENWCFVTTLDGRLSGWARERFLRSAPGEGNYPSHGGGHAGSIAGIVGLEGAAAHNELRSRGFEDVDSFSSGNAVYGIYYYRPSRLCVQSILANGRILDIRDIQSHPKCR